MAPTALPGREGSGRGRTRAACAACRHRSSRVTAALESTGHRSSSPACRVNTPAGPDPTYACKRGHQMWISQISKITAMAVQTNSVYVTGRMALL